MATLGELVVLLKADSSQLNKDLNKTEGATKSWADRYSGIFRKVGLVITGAVAAIGIVTIKMAADFDRALRNVNSIMRVSEGELQNYAGQLLDMSKRLPQSAQNLAEGLYDIASSGFQGAEGMKVLEASAKGASAGLTTTNISAKGLTAVLNAYGYSADKAAEISDIMFKTVDKGVITYEELAGVIGEGVATSAVAGIEFKELSGALAYMTTKGISAAESITSLNRLTLSILDPSEELAEIFKKQGYESGEAALKQLGLAGTMKLIYEAAGNTLPALMKLFPEMRALKGASVLLGSGIEDLTGYMGEFDDTLGSTDRALKEQSKSFSYQATLFKNNISAMAISIGMKMLPALTGLIQKLNELPQSTKDAMENLVTLGLAMGAVGGPTLLLIGYLPKLKTGLDALNISLATTKTLIGGAALAVTILVAGILLLKAAEAKYGIELDGQAARIETYRTKLLGLSSGMEGTQAGLKANSQAMQEYYTRMKDVIGSTDASAAATQANTEALAEQRAELLKSVSAEYNFWSSLESSLKSQEDVTKATKDYNEAVRKHGEGSDEAREKLLEKLKAEAEAKKSTAELMIATDEFTASQKIGLEQLGLTREDIRLLGEVQGWTNEKIEDTIRLFDSLGQLRVEPEIMPIGILEARNEVIGLAQYLYNLNQQRANPQIILDTTQFQAGNLAVLQYLAILATAKASPQAFLNHTEFDKGNLAVLEYLKILGNTKVTPLVSVETEGVSEAQREIDSIHGKTVYIVGKFRVPDYQEGGPILETGQYKLHKGEFVLPERIVSALIPRSQSLIPATTPALAGGMRGIGNLTFVYSPTLGFGSDAEMHEAAQKFSKYLRREGWR